MERCKVVSDPGLERREDFPWHVELIFEVRAEFPLHLIDFANCEHALSNDAPRFVRVRIVTHDLGGNHESGYEKSVS